MRGITWLAPVLLRLHELDQFEDAALVKAKVTVDRTGDEAPGGKLRLRTLSWARRGATMHIRVDHYPQLRDLC